MEFDAFMDQAWADHANDPHGVAARLPDALPELVEPGDEVRLVRLAALVHHVHGEHLGAWRDGHDCLQRLAAASAFSAFGPSGAAVRSSLASLALSEGAPVEVADRGLSASERVRARALAVGNLAERDTPRAARLLQEAVAAARGAADEAAATEPMHRALAIAGNNLACTLEEKNLRSPAERDLMILAAETGREFWARAGTWLETERAEYRLAMTWLHAGVAAHAKVHAQACLDLVDAHAAPPFERFFAWEALGSVAKASGDTAGQNAAVIEARNAFDLLDVDDQAACRAALERLAA